MGLDPNAALAIINEFNGSGEYEPVEVPTDDAGKISLAEKIYADAHRLFHEEGVRGNTIQTILWTGESVMKEVEQKKMADTYPRRSSGGLSEADERETENFPSPEGIPTRERLPVPGHIEGDARAMPRDLSTLPDVEIRKLSGEYNAYLARTIFLLSTESAALVMAQHVLEGEKSRAMKNLPKADKKMTVKEKEAEIADDPQVKEWSKAVSHHEANVAVLKGLKEIYSGNVSVLSREWTMRQNEWEKGR
jgi:hypothetical protein